MLGLWRLHPLESRRCISAGSASIARAGALPQYDATLSPLPARLCVCGCSLLGRTGGLSLFFSFFTSPPRAVPTVAEIPTHPTKHALYSPQFYSRIIRQSSCHYDHLRPRALTRRGAAHPAQREGKSHWDHRSLVTTEIDAGDHRKFAMLPSALLRHSSIALEGAKEFFSPFFFVSPTCWGSPATSVQESREGYLSIHPRRVSDPTAQGRASHWRCTGVGWGAFGTRRIDYPVWFLARGRTSTIRLRHFGMGASGDEVCRKREKGHGDAISGLDGHDWFLGLLLPAWEQH